MVNPGDGQQVSNLYNQPTPVAQYFTSDSPSLPPQNSAIDLYSGKNKALPGTCAKANVCGFDMTVSSALNVPRLKKCFAKKRRSYVTIIDGTTTRKTRAIRTDYSDEVRWNEKLDVL
ncbi:hypothetical protein CPB83DRAFT_855884 [Crepidotus variabilis]|uniref:Uncharacterized protein n=1 Tax=Crepidotus variabilis TaxID=179855 RepID=A0A9P6JPD6_9AGAR|nr:hypothetical protein CPB83DRAFT_855884 [Crepidotus variabilis]